MSNRLDRDNVLARLFIGRELHLEKFPEFVTKMTLSSPLEDLQRFTLQALCGSLRKLEYLAGLRADSAHYTHWGFARVYGDLTADKTMLKAHRAVLSRTLSTHLADLMEDVQAYSENENVPSAVYLEQLSTRGSELLPADPGAGSKRHLSSVLHALSALEKTRRSAAILPNAAQPPQLDR